MGLWWHGVVTGGHQVRLLADFSEWQLSVVASCRLLEVGLD